MAHFSKTIFLALLLFANPAFAAPADWMQFKQLYVSQEGRVIDASQGSISHSEGQGFAMLLATHYGDRDAFDRIWQWTRKNLQVRGDHLFAWRWEPSSGITDKNNASDGDLLVAWALLRASNRWHVKEYLQSSGEIAKDIRAKMLYKAPQGLVLLPGENGFAGQDGVTVNLSYWVFPAIDEMDKADPSPQWGELAKSGMTILGYSRFGRWGLPPDWLILTKIVAPSPRFPKHFGYDAIRIPLYLIWSKRESAALLKPYRDFWSYFKGAKFLPAWTNLDDDSVDSYDASRGIHSLAQWVAGYPGAYSGKIQVGDGYYSSVLSLLADMARDERGLR